MIGYELLDSNEKSATDTIRRSNWGEAGYIKKQMCEYTRKMANV